MTTVFQFSLIYLASSQLPECLVSSMQVSRLLSCPPTLTYVHCFSFLHKAEESGFSPTALLTKSNLRLRKKNVVQSISRKER